MKKMFLFFCMLSISLTASAGLEEKASQALDLEMLRLYTASNNATKWELKSIYRNINAAVNSESSACNSELKDFLAKGQALVSAQNQAIATIASKEPNFKEAYTNAQNDHSYSILDTNSRQAFEILVNCIRSN